MLRFTFRSLASLPRLAWCARLTRGSDEILVEHGPWAEARESFFVEGAWNGSFEDGRLDQATTLLGSGGCIVGDQAVFCTTTHTMERLQSVRVGDELFISNSFVYLLAATGDSPDVNYRFYESDFITFRKGRSAATRSVYTRLKRQVYIYYGERISVDIKLATSIKPYPPGPCFNSYEEYIGAVDSVVARLHENAQSPSRTVRYEPISTLSTGYDSPACTIFAKKIGCHKAITLLDARPNYNAFGRIPEDPSDSGAEIAKHLDVELVSFSRNDYLRRSDYPEAEFLATGNGGDDVVICAAEDHLPKKVLFTGYLGDTLWGLDSGDPSASRDYVYKFPGGGTFGEFRLRVGFIHVPIPLLHYPNHPDTLRISRSPEMAPWRLDNEYDRPIPRRLVETSGVPRAIYAKEKKSVSQPFWYPADPGSVRAMMSAHSYDSLLSYCRSPEVKSQLSFTSKVKALFAPMVAPIPALLNRHNKTLKKAFGVGLLPGLREGQFRTAALFSAPTGLKFHWAAAKVISRYQDTQYKDYSVEYKRPFHEQGPRQSNPE